MDCGPANIHIPSMAVFDDEPETAPRAAPSRQARTERRPPRPITEDYLQRAALHYLERYSSSVENLRRVLRRKVRRSCHHHGTPPEAHEAEIEAVIGRCLRVGHLEDARYAEMRAETLRRRGLSTRMILAKLAEKGVASDLASAALQAVDARAETQDGETGDADEDAARTFARRRRLGPYRRADREERRDRDLAALARGGFAFEIARRIIDSEPDAVNAEPR